MRYVNAPLRAAIVVRRFFALLWFWLFLESQFVYVFGVQPNNSEMARLSEQQSKTLGAIFENAAARQLAKRKNWKKQTPGIQRHRKWSIIHRSKRGGPSASAVEDRPGHFHVVIFEGKRIKHNVIDDRKHAGSEHPSIKRQKGETLLNGSMIWRNERRRKKNVSLYSYFSV